jgi:acetoin utilization deacetylase AcuC-like enzyme
MDARPVLVRDPRFRDHTPPSGHPERPARLDAIDRALEPQSGAVREAHPRPATDDELLRVHSREHLDALAAVAGRRARLDPDTYAAPRSLEIARLAAGATIDLALSTARGEARAGFALVRPPGHHAEPEHAMGFCLLGNVAIAAAALRAEAGVERIAIVDWDVHHGNGTQHCFEEDRDTLFLSLHQFPLYPGTGAFAEMGRGAGEGTTLNLPLPPGCGDPEYALLFEGLVDPVLRAFRPQVLLVSAGFDAHARDPLAQMRVTSDGFARMAAVLRAFADDACGGRLVLALEGGYDLDALGESVAAVVRALAAREAPVLQPAPRTPGAEELLHAFREGHGAHWPVLRASRAG